MGGQPVDQRKAAREEKGAPDSGLNQVDNQQAAAAPEDQKENRRGPENVKNGGVAEQPPEQPEQPAGKLPLVHRDGRHHRDDQHRAQRRGEEGGRFLQQIGQQDQQGVDKIFPEKETQRFLFQQACLLTGLIRGRPAPRSS